MARLTTPEATLAVQISSLAIWLFTSGLRDWVIIVALHQEFKDKYIN